jgi:hypothetical protein
MQVTATGFQTNFFQRLGSMSPSIGGAQVLSLLALLLQPHKY